jgi:hypothetical protein
VLPVPSDDTFAGFIAGLHAQGASASTIAGALNRSEWADRDGRKWHWCQVAALIESQPAEPPESSPVAVEPDGTPALRLALLRAVREWRPFDEWNVEAIWALHQRGDQIGEIATKMNRAGTLAPNGQQWTQSWVNVLLSVHLVVAAGDNDAEPFVALSA